MIDAVDVAAFGSLCAPVPAVDFIRLLEQAGFSAEAYRDAYPDFAGLNWGPKQAVSHFFHYGLDERRVAPLTLDRQALVALARLPIHNGAFKARLLTAPGGHLFNTIDRCDVASIAERWPTVRALAREAACPYFVAGDSHSRQYALTGARDDTWLLPIHLLYTGGSAAGLGNSASHSGYGFLMRQAVQVIGELPGADEIPFLIQFGQVDIEFVYHFRRVRDGERKFSLMRYHAFCDRLLEQYIQFVIELFCSPARLRPCLVSVFPPALSDAAWHQGYVNAEIVQRETTASTDDLRAGIRELEIASLRQRTDAHVYYNDRLRAECLRNGFGFIDSTTPFLGVGGTVDPHFVNPDWDGAEHHLDYRRTYDTICKLIWHCIDATGRPRALTAEP